MIDHMAILIFQKGIFCTFCIIFAFAFNKPVGANECKSEVGMSR